MQLNTKPNYELLINVLKQYHDTLPDEQTTCQFTVFKLLKSGEHLAADEYPAYKLAVYGMLTNLTVTVSTPSLLMLLPNVHMDDDVLANNPIDSVFKFAHGANDSIFIMDSFNRFDLKVLIEQLANL